MASPNASRIFVAEAAPHQTTALVEILRSAGYQIDRHGVVDSLKELLQRPPDLVLIQVTGVTREAYRLCRQIRANPALARLPVMFACTAAALQNPAQMFAAGGDDYVAIPCTAAELLARIEHHLDRKRPDANRPPLLQASLQRLHNSLDLDTVLQTAVRDVRQQTQADRVLIYQFQNNRRGVVTHEAIGQETLSILHRQVEDACFDQDHAARYWSGRVGQIDDVAALDRVSQCYRDMLLGFDIKANLVVPIIHNLSEQSRYLWGLMILHQCYQPRQWLASEIEMLQELSAHLAIAIQQSHLFDQVHRRARQEILLNRILDEIHASLDVQPMLTGAVEHLRAALNLRQCGVTLLQHNLPKLPTPFLVTVQDPALGETIPPLNITDSLRRQLLLDSDVRVTPYLTNPAKFRPHPAQPIVQDQTTYIATAIRTDSQVQGVLWACPNPAQLTAATIKTITMEAWEYSDRRLIEEVALQLSQALHQAELYQQLQTAHDELQRLAHRDGLTQIANRREFDRYLAQEWQRLQRERGSLALVLADVDHFKGFNDTYGHLAGDDCLRSIGRLLAQVTKRPADLAARYGGEEFALILPNTNAAGAIALASEAQTYLNRLAIPNRASPIYGQVTLSFGITALIPTSALAPEVLMRRADQALYAAKKIGRNRYCLWSEAIESGQGQSTGSA